MLTELELSGIADFLTNSNDLMSRDEQAVYLASAYEKELTKAKFLIEAFQNKFGLTSIILEDDANTFLRNFLEK